MFGSNHDFAAGVADSPQSALVEERQPAFTLQEPSWVRFGYRRAFQSLALAVDQALAQPAFRLVSTPITLDFPICRRDRKRALLVDNAPKTIHLNYSIPTAKAVGLGETLASEMPPVLSHETPQAFRPHRHRCATVALALIGVVENADGRSAAGVPEFDLVSPPKQDQSTGATKQDTPVPAVGDELPIAFHAVPHVAQANSRKSSILVYFHVVEISSAE